MQNITAGPRTTPLACRVTARNCTTGQQAIRLGRHASCCAVYLFAKLPRRFRAHRLDLEWLVTDGIIRRIARPAKTECPAKDEVAGGSRTLLGFLNSPPRRNPASGCNLATFPQANLGFQPQARVAVSSGNLNCSGSFSHACNILPPPPITVCPTSPFPVCVRGGRPSISTAANMFVAFWRSFARMRSRSGAARFS